MALEKILTPKRVPENIRAAAPWLNDDYVRKHGYIPVSGAYPFGGEKTEFGFLPYKYKKEIKIGDIIIFDEHDEEYNDKFEIVDKEISGMIIFGELGGPVGIVVPRPDN